MEVDAAGLAAVLSRIDDRLRSIDRGLAALTAAAELSAQSDNQIAAALERVLALISAEPAESENDLCETLRALVAATQENGTLIGRLLLSVNRLPQEIAEHVTREPV